MVLVLVRSQDRPVDGAASSYPDPATYSRLHAGVNALERRMFTANLDVPAPPRGRSKGEVREAVLLRFGLEVRNEAYLLEWMKREPSLHSYLLSYERADIHVPWLIFSLSLSFPSAKYFSFICKVVTPRERELIF